MRKYINRDYEPDVEDANNDTHTQTTTTHELPQKIDTYVCRYIGMYTKTYTYTELRFLRTNNNRRIRHNCIQRKKNGIGVQSERRDGASRRQGVQSHSTCNKIHISRNSKCAECPHWLLFPRIPRISLIVIAPHWKWK